MEKYIKCDSALEPVEIDGALYECEPTGKTFKCPNELGLAFGMLSPLDEINMVDYIDKLNQKIVELLISCGGRCQ